MNGRVVDGPRLGLTSTFAACRDCRFTAQDDDSGWPDERAIRAQSLLHAYAFEHVVDVLRPLDGTQAVDI